jgi:hypothetical protein
LQQLSGSIPPASISPTRATQILSRGDKSLRKSNGKMYFRLQKQFMGTSKQRVKMGQNGSKTAFLRGAVSAISSPSVPKSGACASCPVASQTT